jgi:predicted amidohydrolase YtcJ
MYADLVLYNGIIRTQSDLYPRVSAIAIRAGKIVAIGDDVEVLDFLSPRGGKKIDLQGKLVLPGLVDAHVHLTWYAAALQAVDLVHTSSVEDAVSRVATRARQTPVGQWIRGHGWAQIEWPGGAFPTAADLDARIPDHPVYLTAHSTHAGWINSAALRLAGITASTPNPDGGRIGHDAAGQPNGLLFETAMELVKTVIPTPSPNEIANQVKAAIERAHRGGLTGIHDFDGADAFRAYQILRDRGDLTLRIVKNIPVQLLDHAIALGLRWGLGDEVLRIGGVKTFADGALGPRTAWMIEPYENEPENYGISVTDPEEMYENVSRASAAHLPSTIHAIGDRAVHEVLNVYEAVRKEEAARGITPDQMRHRIEHVQLIHPDDVNRLAQLGIIASMQPNHATSDMIMADAYWGNRADYSYNWRLQMDAGAPIAFGSDAPIEPIEPLPNIQAAVTRRRLDGSPGVEGWRSGEQGRLSVDEAVRGFTRGPAYAAGTEAHLGQLTLGYLADLVVLERDIYNIDPMEIAQTAVLGTMVGGRWVYRDFE